MALLTCLVFFLLVTFAYGQETNGTVSNEELVGTRKEITTAYTQGALRGSLILHNGNIYTQDSKNRVVTVVAIDDGQIVYVGNSSRDAAKLFRKPPRSIDLKGRIAVPGLIDCHNHIAILGNKPGYHRPLEHAYSIADVQTIYRREARTVPRGEFITTIGGFHPNQFKELRLPTLSELDAAVPNHPVFLSVGFSGPSTTNTLGRSLFLSLPPSLRPVIAANGTISQGLENGKALLSLRQNHTLSQKIRSTHRAMAYAASLGVTTHLDQGAFPATGTPADWSANEDLYSFHKPWLAVYAAGQGIIRLRMNFLHFDNDTALSSVAARLNNTFPFFGNAMVRTGGIGEFAVDIAHYERGPVFESAVAKIAEAGWRLEIHSLTSTDFISQIRVFEKVNARHDMTRRKWVLAHVPQITPEYLHRLKRLGGGVNLSGWLYLAGTGNDSRPAGPPLRWIREAQIPAGGGADGPNIAPLSPWPHVYYFVTGRNARGQLINPGQTATRAEALRLFTSANTWFLGGQDEEQLGVLEVGRLGDVAVLSHDYWTVEEAGLKNITSVLTVVGGVVVHGGGNL